MLPWCGHFSTSTCIEAACLDDADHLQALEDLVAARIAGEEDRLSVRLGEHDDARQVRHRVVVEAGQRLPSTFRTSSGLSVTPFRVILLQRRRFRPASVR